MLFVIFSVSRTVLYRLKQILPASAQLFVGFLFLYDAHA